MKERYSEVFKPNQDQILEKKDKLAQVLHFNTFGNLIQQQGELSSIKVVPKVEEERNSEFGIGKLIIDNFAENAVK